MASPPGRGDDARGRAWRKLAGLEPDGFLGPNSSKVVRGTASAWLAARRGRG